LFRSTACLRNYYCTCSWRTLVWFLEHARHDLNVALLTGFWMAIFCLYFE
jgi:hypothetical protein